ncbi:hypothetical protein AVEN_16162-1 [Araneus ventricosus]|uniref:Uncharacterized protein n=2 Tax=Araneus ventricosus TaxID=182803 RepID=A0A4Y2L0F5_ARAVE|nr:hypothetical protein AVEN_16162-1 [Araneus ventricosus]
MLGTWIVRFASNVIIMKAVFLLVVLVALVAMAMAGVHHYKIPSGGDTHDTGHHGGGSIFDTAASAINGIL